MNSQISINTGNDYRAISVETLTVDNTVKKLTPPLNAKYAFIVAESSITNGIVIRYWVGGAEPSNSVGIPLAHLQAFDLTEKQNLNTFRVIQAQAGTHKLQIQYFG